MEEREYSVLEIIKVNIKNWKIVCMAMIICAVILGIYQYKTVHPMEVKYSQTNQMNASFYMKEYNSESIVERFLSIKALGQSHEAYQAFREMSGCEIDYDGYRSLLNFVDSQYVDVQQFYFSYPENYGTLSIVTEEEALKIVKCLGTVLENMCDTYIGKGTITIIDEGYSTIVTHVEEGTPTSNRDVLFAVVKGGIAGSFFGFVLAFVIISLSYMLGTVSKTADEIRAGLNVPILAFVHGKKNYKDEIVKARLFFDDKDVQLINYMTFGPTKYDGAKDLADCFEQRGKKVCLIGVEDEIISSFLDGNTGKETINNYLNSKMGQYDIVIISSPNLQNNSNVYTIAKLCPENIIAFQRRRMGGIQLEDIRNTVKVNNIHLTGAIIYGN